MKILLTGSNGYIGKRLLPILIEMNYEVVCCVRDIDRFHAPATIKNKVKIIELDLLKREHLKTYLKILMAHLFGSFNVRVKDYEKLEINQLKTFVML